MIRRHSVRPRSGVTLTEILISILILGVGLVSLATLFPLGLLRLRTAQRLVRSTYLAESAIDELKTRNLLTKVSFTHSLVFPLYQAGGFAYDPWVQDTPAYGSAPYVVNVVNGVSVTTPVGAAASIAPGLPVAYDPLWWNVVGQGPLGIHFDNANPTSTYEGRFGSGLGFLRPSGSGPPSANGLQRLNNLVGPWTGMTPSIQQQLNYQVALETFVSPEDILFQDPKGQYPDPSGTGLNLGGPSPIVPDLSQGMLGPNSNTVLQLPNNPKTYAPVNDWRFTWMITGQQRDTINGSIFDVDIVVHENRAFGVDPIQTPSGAIMQPSGETVVEAVWGYGSSVQNGFAVGARRTVLLLWPASQPDPEVKVGQWIADVTYERVLLTAQQRYGSPPPALAPAQRCFWYQIAKRTDPAPASVTFAGANYRQMTVWTTTDLDAQSLLTGLPAVPVNVEAALIAPSVVNVIPRQVYTR